MADDIYCFFMIYFIWEKLFDSIPEVFFFSNTAEFYVCKVFFFSFFLKD